MSHSTVALEAYLDDPVLERYTNEFSRFVRVGDVDIHYRDEGEGEPVVLVHGAFSSLHTYDVWADHLRDHFRVIRLDMPGFALTGPNAANRYSMEGQVEYLIRFLDALGIADCHIAGSSLGGWVSWEAAARYPERFNRMILIGAAGFITRDTMPLPFKMMQAPFAGRVVKFALKRSLMEVFMRQVFHDPSRITSEMLDRYYHLNARPGNPEAFYRIVNSPFIDNTQHLRRIKMPVLLMWGEHDKWVPLEHAGRFAEILPNTETLVYPHAGHIPMEEIADESVDDAIDFLR